MMIEDLMPLTNGLTVALAETRWSVTTPTLCRSETRRSI
jgi:hypothetical protein